MRAKQKGPDPEDQSSVLPRKLLRRKSQPRVSGRLDVRVEKKEIHGFLGMSIEADATVVVEKDGETHILRAKPEPEKERQTNEESDRY